MGTNKTSAREERLTRADISQAWTKDRIRSELGKSLNLLNDHQDREQGCVAMLKQALLEIKELKTRQDILGRENQHLKAQNKIFKKQLSEVSADRTNVFCSIICLLLYTLGGTVVNQITLET